MKVSKLCVVESSAEIKDETNEAAGSRRRRHAQRRGDRRGSGLGLFAGLGAFRGNGHHWTSAVVLPFMGGLLMVGLTAVFYFGLNLSWLWPLFFIAGGLLLIAVPMLLPKN